MQETIKIKKPAKIQTLVNWYYGNYCTRKCYAEIVRTFLETKFSGEERHARRIAKIASTEHST